MSHKRKCGCIIADSKDRSVRMGYELGGYIKSFCAEHTPIPQPNNAVETYTKTEVEWIKQALKQRLIDAVNDKEDDWFCFECGGRVQEFIELIEKVFSESK